MQKEKEADLDGRTDGARRGIGRFLSELRRRHVVRAALAYAAVGFVVLQAAEIVHQAWGFPEWVLRLVVVFTLLGFPLVLALAWVYEVTPHGIRTMREVDRAAGLTGHGTPGSGTLPRVALLLVTALAVGASGWWWVRSTVAEEGARARSEGAFLPAAATGDARMRSLAVLPFESFADGPGREYFAPGMHEALISQLGQLDFLRVLSRTSVAQYDAGGKSAPRIGAELGVDALIEGSVLLAGDRVRITVQLIDAAADRHLWSQDYEGDLVDVIALQREVAGAIVQEIRGELSPALPEVLAGGGAPRPADPEATGAVMRGRMALAGAMDAAEPPAETLDAAELHFRSALRREPGLASAHAGLAQVHLMRSLSSEGWGEAAVEAALESARRAVELDPSSREAHEILAHAGLFGSAGEPGSPTSIPSPPPAPTEAVGTRPSLPGATGTVVAVTEAGRQIQVALARREARTGAPPAMVRGARRLADAGLHLQARELLEQVLRLETGNAEAWDVLEQIHRARGEMDAVVALRRGRGGPSGEEPPAAEELARAVARAGIRGYWEWRLGELERREREGVAVSPVDLAAAHAGLGDADRAFELLEDAAGKGDPRLASLRSDPVWDPYRRDPRFMGAMAAFDPARGAGRASPPAPAGTGRRGG